MKDEEQCKDCIHVEVCRHYGYPGCDFHETGKIAELGEEMRKVRSGIVDEKVLIGFNMAIAICNKYLGEEKE